MRLKPHPPPTPVAFHTSCCACLQSHSPRSLLGIVDPFARATDTSVEPLPGATESQPHRPVLAQGMPRRARRPARPHRAALGLRRPCPHRPARRQRDGSRAARAGLPELYVLRFPIRHMQLRTSRPDGSRPADNDISGRSSAGRRCRRRVPAAREPAGGRTTRTDSRSTSTRVRTPTSVAARRGTRRGPPTSTAHTSAPAWSTPAVVAAFASIGWGWGGLGGVDKGLHALRHNGH